MNTMFEYCYVNQYFAESQPYFLTKTTLVATNNGFIIPTLFLTLFSY